MANEQETLTASNLKQELWSTLLELRTDKISAARADSIAATGREILRTGKLQLQIARQAKRDVPVELIAFSEDHD